MTLYHVKSCKRLFWTELGRAGVWVVLGRESCSWCREPWWDPGRWPCSEVLAAQRPTAAWWHTSCCWVRFKRDPESFSTFVYLIYLLLCMCVQVYKNQSSFEDSYNCQCKVLSQRRKGEVIWGNPRTAVHPFLSRGSCGSSLPSVSTAPTSRSSELKD